MEPIGGFQQAAEGGILLEPQTGSGCRIYMLHLESGRERRLALPAPSGASDTTPSIWHGRVTFARRAPRHGNIWQVLTWSQARPRVVTTLRHGAIPTRCERTRACEQRSCERRHSCSEGGVGADSRPLAGRILALASDKDLVTFLWQVQGPGVVGEAATEVRVDDLRTARSSLANAEVIGEVCTRPPGPPENGYTEPPIASGTTAPLSELLIVGCFEEFVGGQRRRVCRVSWVP